MEDYLKLRLQSLLEYYKLLLLPLVGWAREVGYQWQRKDKEMIFHFQT